MRSNCRQKEVESIVTCHLRLKLHTPPLAERSLAQFAFYAQLRPDAHALRPLSPPITHYERLGSGNDCARRGRKALSRLNTLRSARQRREREQVRLLTCPLPACQGGCWRGVEVALGT